MIFRITFTLPLNILNEIKVDQCQPLYITFLPDSLILFLPYLYSLILKRMLPFHYSRFCISFNQSQGIECFLIKYILVTSSILIDSLPHYLYFRKLLISPIAYFAYFLILCVILYGTAFTDFRMYISSTFFVFQMFLSQTSSNKHWSSNM